MVGPGSELRTTMGWREIPGPADIDGVRTEVKKLRAEDII